MLRLPLTALSIVCLILLSVWSLWRSTVAPFFIQLPLAVPTATLSVAIAEVQPAPTATLVPLSAATGIALLPPFQLVLPVDWQYVNVSNEGARAQWQATAQSQLPKEMQRLLNVRFDKELTLVLAWPTVPEGQSGLIAYAAPRQDLTLAQYVADSAAGLRAQTGVTLHQAEVNYTLQGEVPVAFLHYTLPAGQSTPVHSAREGYQVLLFDKAAAHLLLLTISLPELVGDTQIKAAADSKPPIPAVIQSIVRAVKR